MTYVGGYQLDRGQNIVFKGAIYAKAQTRPIYLSLQRGWNGGGRAVERGGAGWNTRGRGFSRFALGFFGTQTIGAFARRCLSRLEMFAASESR